MEHSIVKLRSEKELKIFMDPLRQRMLRTMEIIGKPVTAKKLADTMEITPSSAKHHLTQLESIGLVGVDHTEQIHGITAVFYKMLPVDVHLGLGIFDCTDERAVLAENLLMSVYTGFYSGLREKVRMYGDRTEQTPFWGDMLTGVLHLTQAQADEMHELINRFVHENDAAREDTIPFEYALVIYNAGDENESAL